ncbi:COX18 [[Candida] subhashii]|uniref:COX18 n=1 Tax=[Candida] subhashii TaxID=561895 RepID=A0A8J5V2P7_9ASCO|nr:COX18 [[Candida] subhashii]KAG7666200.1 COX18 [[Candida] subhashii]
MTESFQQVHQYTGLPWWALIPIATFTLRSIWTMPLAVLQRKRLQKQSALRPIISATNPILKMNLAKQVNKAKAKATKQLEKIDSGKSEDYSELSNPLVNMKYEQILILSAKETRKRQKQLFKRFNIQIYKNFLLPIFQIPLWIIMSITMRDLSGWSSWDNLHNKALDPTLYTEGLLWFTDLTINDSLHVFPLLLGITSLANIEWSFKTLELSRLTKRQSRRPTFIDAMGNLSRLMVIFMMSISTQAPVALTLYWLSSQLYSLIQNIIMDLLMPISFTPKKRLNYSQSTNKNSIDIINH